MIESKPIEVVAALIFQNGRVLACQRRTDGPFPLKWEFPGGKIEAGEDPRAALARELQEELGIEIQGCEQVFTHTHAYAGFSSVYLRFFHVRAYQGRIANRVFERIAWVSPQELATLDFLDGDRPVIEWLASGNGTSLWRVREA